MANINSLYLLTPMTGRTAGSDRTMIIMTVEMKWRSFWIALAAFIPGLILTVIFTPMLGAWALLWLAGIEAAAFYLIERRSKDGLRLRTYQSMFDKKRSNLNVFYLCGSPIEITGTQFGTIQQVTAPVHKTTEDPDLSDVFGPDFEA